MSRLLQGIVELQEAGGAVMWPLLGVSVLGWTLIFLRLIALRRVGAMTGLRTEVDIRVARKDLRRHGAVIDSLVAAAPLLGLLGTVSGMIATFEGLTSMSLFSEGGGVAGGISEALMTTQAGLAVAIPCFFVNRVIGRRARILEGLLAEEGGMA